LSTQLPNPRGASLRGARVLITGGAGLIGSHIVDRLVGAEPAEIIVYDNLSRGRRQSLADATAKESVKLIEGDIRNRTLLAEATRGVDVLFHLAAIRLTQCAQEPQLALEVMVDGTFNVLEAAVAARVKRVIAASSASIYGNAERFPIHENHHPYNNDTIYGAAKLFNEGLLASFRKMYGLNYLVLRPFNVYGPRMDTHGAYTEVLVRWMDRIDRGLAPVIFGDGKQTMDLIYVEDVARAFVIAATSDAEGEVFNIGTGIETSLDKLACMLIAAMGSHLSPEYSSERHVGTVPRRLADVSQARSRLGFMAEVSLEEGLCRLVAWWRKVQDERRQ
jgi:UDP-glucose 4-epimerase